ncbi:MAG: hypothetical protein E6J62_19080 [Deltaproteobacteria bacterium]|nr:MAG: hypothetical protein E6J61_21225 [Deltaproteobacteria bacterium]TMB27678.1 MAG: hypothetical protein E6J62_19080 [Deltaproteobacteria bacterium]
MDLGKLQGAVDQVDREIGVLGRSANGQGSALGLAWSRLVTVLALEPPRPMRACPRCGELGMRDATVCGYCWLKLVPPAEQSAAAPRTA